MKNEKMFEIAVRNKLRFPFRGLISTEDLWDLNVENLDVVFKELNSQIKRVQEESLLKTKSKQDEELELKISIVKYIVAVKLEETDLRVKAMEKREQKQKILKILSDKQDEALQNKSIEELEKMLEEL